MEEGKYCIYCGFRLSQSSGRCPNCGREQTEKEDLFKEYLLKNTKESLRVKIEEGLFTIIKNWLLSHLYGIVLLITVIAAGIYVSSARSAVRVETLNMQERPAAVSSGTSEHGSGSERGGLRELSDNVCGQVNEYQRSMFYWTIEEDEGAGWGPNGYPDEIPERPETFRLPAEYGTGRHDYVFVRDYDEVWSSMDRETLSLNEPSTEFGKELLQKGFNVVEITVHDMFVKTLDDDSEQQGQNDYLFVMAEIDGVWCVAEDISI